MDRSLFHQIDENSLYLFIRKYAQNIHVRKYLEHQIF